MFGGRGRGVFSGGDSSLNNGGNGDASGGFLDDPFDKEAATNTPAEWQGGGAWDEAGAGASAGVGDSGFGEDSSGFGDRGAAPTQPGGYIPGQQGPPQYGGGAGKQPQHGPPVDAAEMRRRPGMGMCAIEGLIHGVQGAVIGSIFGVFGGVSEGLQAGARGKPLILHTLYRAGGSAMSFGAWIGIYHGSKCSMSVARGGKKDAFNAFVAGFAAGAIPALPTRNPRIILFSALGSAGLMGSIEAAGSFFGGGGGGGGH